jgi:CRISPR-associated protein (Cas_Csd1)
VFRIAGQEKYLHELPVIVKYWGKLIKADLIAKNGQCGISNQNTQIVDQEFLKVGGIPDSTGMPGLGNFFTNHKKSVQNWNSDSSMFQHRVGIDAYIAIYNGLNYLLNNEHHYIRLGDAKYVFWAADETGAKTIALKRIFTPKADVKETAPSTREVVTTLKSVFSYGATNPQGNPDTFYIASFRRSNNRAWIDTMRQGNVSDIYKNMKKWITTQSIFTSKVYGIQSLASSLLSSAERNKQKSPLRSNVDAILQNSLFATPLPHDFLGTLVNRIAAAGKANKPQINLLTLTLDLMPMTTESSDNVDLSQLCDREKDAYIFGRMTSFVRYVSHRVSPNKNTLADNLEQFFLQSPTVGATQMMKLFTMYVKSAKSTNYWRDRFNTEFPLVPVATRRFSLREQALYLIGANANDWYRVPPAKDNHDSENSLDTRSIKNL